MKRVFDSPFLNKAALVLIWLLLMGGTFFYANKNYFLYHENPNLIKADGYYLYNFGSPRHYYWALPVKFTHEGKVYHSQLPLDIRDESSILYCRSSHLHTGRFFWQYICIPKQYHHSCTMEDLYFCSTATSSYIQKKSLGRFHTL